MAVMEGLHLTSLLAGALVAGLPAVLLVLKLRRDLRRSAAVAQDHARALERHRHTEQLLQAIIGNSSDAIFAKDLEGRYLLMNRHALQVLGKTEAQVLGQTDAALYPAEVAQRVRDNDLPVLHQGETVQFEHTVRGPQGTRVFLAVKAPLRDAGDRIVGMFGISRDVTERQQMDQALRESEARYRSMIEQAPDAIVVHRSGRILYANPAALRMAGVASAELALGRRVLDFTPVESRDEIDRLTRELFTSRDGWEVVEVQIGRADGSVIDVAVRGARVDFDGAPAVQITMRDISGRKRAQRALLASEAQLRATLHAIPDWLFETDAQGRYLAVHAPNDELAASTSGQLVGRLLSDVLPPEAARTSLEAIRQAQADGHSAGAQIMLDLPSGRHWFELSVARKDAPGGQVQRFIVLARDISTHTRDKERLQTALHNQEALLHEVHHRVKNNLQVIDSLLRMEHRRAGEEPTRAVLQDMQGRIRAMAQLHETLFRSGAVAQVDLPAYLRQLLTRTLQARPTGAAVQLQLALDPVQVDMDQATACGLLVNELVGNSLQHGFAGQRGGTLQVALTRQADTGRFQLQVSDDGTGLPPDWEVRRQQGLGLQLACDLAGQLGGELQIDPGPPACFRVQFERVLP